MKYFTSYGTRAFICALRLRPDFEKLFIGANVGRRAQKISTGCKKVYEIDPGKHGLFGGFKSLLSH